jgi:hypothetical protein
MGCRAEPWCLFLRRRKGRDGIRLTKSGRHPEVIDMGQAEPGNHAPLSVLDAVEDHRSVAAFSLVGFDPHDFTAG